MTEESKSAALALLNSLAVPRSEVTSPLFDRPAEELGAHLGMLITDNVVDEVWKSWNPHQIDRVAHPAFRRAFKTILTDCVSMGLSLNRIRDTCRKLPEPDEAGHNWTPLFEGAIAGRDKCTIRIHLSPGRHRTYTQIPSPDTPGETWNSVLTEMGDGLFYELGVIFPQASVIADQSLEDEQFRVEWNDLKLPHRQGIRADQVLVGATKERLERELGIQAERTVNPGNDEDHALVHIKVRGRCDENKLTTWDSQGYIILAVSSSLRRSAGAFVNRILIDRHINSLAQVWPDLISEVFTITTKDVVVQVLRELVSEGISIRDLGSILQVIASARSVWPTDLSKYIVFAHPAEPVVMRTYKNLDRLTISDLVEHERGSLKRYISHKYTRGQNTLKVFLVDPETESRLRQRADLTSEESASLAGSIRYDFKRFKDQNAAILTSQDIRRRLRDLIYHEFPGLAVLSYQELSPDMNIQSLSRISPDLEPYDESFHRLLETISLPRTTAKFATDESAGEPLPASPFTFLRTRQDEIFQLVRNGILIDHPEASSLRVLDHLLELFIEAYAELLLTGRTSLLEALSRALSPAFQARDAKISHIYALPLRVAEAVGRMISGESADPGRALTFAAMRELLEKADAAARNAAMIIVRAALHSKLGGVLP
jgi:hypothetical protein